MRQLFSRASNKSSRLKLGVTAAAIVAVLGLGVGASTLRAQAHDMNTTTSAAKTDETVASGFIEADEVNIASELGGRILSLPVAEGADVKAGDTLVQLDHGIADAELNVAQSKLQAAEAALAKVKAGARAEEIRQAEAAVSLAQANLKAAGQSVQDAQTLLKQQQSLDLQITQANTQVDVSRNQLDAAGASQVATQTTYDHTDKDERLKELKDYELWQSWIGVNSAQAGYDGAQATLKALQTQRELSVAQKAQVNAAASAYHTAQAALAQAQAQLSDIKAGATTEQIGVAQAQVGTARAAVDAAAAKVKKLTLYAPVNGQVIAHALKEGELAGPGATILTVANLDTLSLVVYVPADKLGLVQLGTKVPLQVDGYPNQTFEGEVVNIADKADFVPNNVQSDEDKASMVFEVKLHIANTGHTLKPGLPADAHFQGQ
jgi:multidrug efflux pump subunit AcrA (membrane-fusion protein)